MFLPVYVLTLGISSAILGAFARHLLSAQGLLPDFDAGIAVTCGVGALYAATQLFFMTLMRLLKPARSSAPLISESLSHAAALLLVPYLLHVAVPWPHSLLYTVEPYVYLGLFVAAHGAFKLFTIFTLTRCPVAGRLGALGWGAAGFAALMGVQATYDDWQAALQEARVAPLQPAEPVQVGESHAVARPALEGAMYTFEAPAGGESNLVLRWANPPDSPEPLQEIHVRFWVNDQEVDLQQPQLRLADGWTEMRLPAALLGNAATECGVSWSGESGSDWMQKFGLRLLDTSARTLMISGPFLHAPKAVAKKPSLIVLLIEGVGSEHLGACGYSRDTMPKLAGLARAGQFFSHAYSPAPELAAAGMTLLTGVNPLVHQFLGPQHGPLPDDLKTLPELLQAEGFATAIFTEAMQGEAGGLDYGSGFERGFECFFTGYDKAGSARTLAQALAWLKRNVDDQVMLVVRLRELRQIKPLERYGTTFTGQNLSTRPLDLYDNALTYMDTIIGEFLANVTSLPEMADTCVVVASPYGFDFSAGWNAQGEARLSESSLRVPLYLLLPGVPRGTVDAVTALEDVAPTLATALGVTFPQPPTGTNLLANSGDGEAISMMAEPLALSLRNVSWRFTWQSGISPFTLRENAEQGVIEFLNLNYYERKWRQPNNLARESSLAAKYRDRLWEYVRQHLRQQQATVTPETTETAAPAAQ